MSEFNDIVGKLLEVRNEQEDLKWLKDKILQERDITLEKNDSLKKELKRIKDNIEGKVVD